jgi:hypothetical protein
LSFDASTTFGEIEVHLRVGLARQHGEADHVLADFLDHFGQGDEVARALAHLDRLAGAQQPHHLHQLDVQRRAPRQRLHRGADALDRAGVVGPQMSISWSAFCSFSKW